MLGDEEAALLQRIVLVDRDAACDGHTLQRQATGQLRLIVRFVQVLDVNRVLQILRAGHDAQDQQPQRHAQRQQDRQQTSSGLGALAAINEGQHRK